MKVHSRVFVFLDIFEVKEEQILMWKTKNGTRFYTENTKKAGEI